MTEPKPKSWETKVQEIITREKEARFGTYGLSAYDGKIQGVGTYILSKLLDVGGGGGLIGYPVEEWCKQNPLAKTDDYQLNIVLAPNKIPPFTKTVTIDGKRVTINCAQITIPSPMIDLTYDAIRYACGDDNGLPWGNYIARAYVSADGTDKRFGQRQIVARGQSGAGALRNLDRILTLYDIGNGQGKGKVLDKRTSHGENEKQNRRDMYPAWIWIHKPSLISKPDKLKKIKIYIFEKKEPESFKEQLRAILQ